MSNKTESTETTTGWQWQGKRHLDGKTLLGNKAKIHSVCSEEIYFMNRLEVANHKRAQNEKYKDQSQLYSGLYTYRLMKSYKPESKGIIFGKYLKKEIKITSYWIFESVQDEFYITLEYDLLLVVIFGYRL